MKGDDCTHSPKKGLYKFSLRSQIGPEAPLWLFTEQEKEDYGKQKRKKGGKQEEGERE